MQDKDTLVARMIDVCKSDLENIGLQITTMNIADVDDHRLTGVEEPDLYIALLKRIQTVNAETQARQATANADAASSEQKEIRRAEVEVRVYENQLENLMAETRVNVATENQRKAVGIEQAKRSAHAQVAGMTIQIAAEKEKIGMLRKKFEAEVITHSLATKERLILQAKAEAAKIMGKAQAEIDQLKETLSILSSQDKTGRQLYIIENFEHLIAPFAEILGLYPVENLTILTGAEGSHPPISAIHPHAIELEKNKMIAGAISTALKTHEKKKQQQKESAQAEG
jgi:hypothetical protein